jgi:hypothetical protein
MKYACDDTIVGGWESFEFFLASERGRILQKVMDLVKQESINSYLYV